MKKDIKKLLFIICGVAIAITLITGGVIRRIGPGGGTGGWAYIHQNSTK